VHLTDGLKAAPFKSLGGFDYNIANDEGKVTGGDKSLVFKQTGRLGCSSMQERERNRTAKKSRSWETLRLSSWLCARIKVEAVTRRERSGSRVLKS